MFEVPDACADPRFQDDPLVAKGPRARFFAGAPIRNGEGRTLGVLDPTPRALTDFQARTLAVLAPGVAISLERRRGAREGAPEAGLLRLVAECLPVRIASLDRDFRFRFVNDAYLDPVGLAREAAVGRTLAESLGEPVLRGARANLERAFAGETHTQEFEAPYPNGARWVRATYVPDRDPSSEVRGALVQVIDLMEERRADAALRAGETRYQALFDSLADGFCVIEMIQEETGRPVDYRFLETNAAFEAQTGIGRSDVAAGRTMREIVPEHEAFWFETYGRVARTGESIAFESEARALGRWYEVHAVRLGPEGSAQVGVLSKDVTERRRQAVALAEEQTRLDRTLERAGVATFDWDVFADRLRGNALLGLFCGFPSESGDRSIEDFLGGVNPDDRARRRAGLETALASGTSYESQYRVAGADARERWVLARGDVSRDPDGKALRVTGVVLDLTARLAAERATAEREELFRAVFEQAPDDAIVVMDAGRAITAWNPAAARITGWSAEEAIGGSADRLFTPEDRALGAPARETALAARAGRAEDERWHRRRDGSRFWGSGTMNALDDAAGRGGCAASSRCSATPPPATRRPRPSPS